MSSKKEPELSIIEVEPELPLIEEERVIVLTMDELVAEAKVRGLLYKKIIKKEDGLLILQTYISEDQSDVLLAKNKKIYERYTAKRLKQIAKEKGISGYYKLNKKDIIDKLSKYFLHFSTLY